MHTNRFSRVSAVALTIGSIVAAPAFAAGNGNAGGDSASHSSSENAGGKSANKSGASDLGKLNGVLHASPEALNSYLAGGANAKTAADVHAALEKAANKPLDATTIAAVDAKLAKNDPTLAKAIAAHPGAAAGLAKEIAAAGPAKKATGTTVPAPKMTVQ